MGERDARVLVPIWAGGYQPAGPGALQRVDTSLWAARVPTWGRTTVLTWVAPEYRPEGCQGADSGGCQAQGDPHPSRAPGARCRAGRHRRTRWHPRCQGAADLTTAQSQRRERLRRGGCCRQSPVLFGCQRREKQGNKRIQAAPGSGTVVPAGHRGWELREAALLPRTHCRGPATWHGQSPELPGPG